MPAAPSSPARSTDRRPGGLLLSSPKQPQPRSGRNSRNSTTAHMAVVLRYCEDMSEAEVAAALGISQGTVKSTVSRAVAKLRIDAELLKR